MPSPPIPPQDTQLGAPPTAPAPPGDNFDMKWLNYELTAFENPWASGWDLKRVLEARDAHAWGNFFVSSLFAQVTLSNTTVLKAMNQRVAPSLNMQRRVIGDGIGERIRAEAAGMIVPARATAIPRKFIATTLQDFAMMGFSIWQNVVTPRPGGGRLDFCAKPWPAQCAYWNPYRKCYQAITSDGLIDVVHGDGKWVVFEPYGRRSYLMGAVYSLAVVYADIMYAYRDRSSNANAWGTPKLVGGLPQDIKLGDPDAKKFQTQMQKMQAGRQAGMLKPFGADVEKIEMMGLSAPVFQKIIDDRKADIADAFTGQSGTSGPSGAAHGYASLFEGVLYSLIARDCGELDAGASSGFFAPWYIVNTGKDRATAPMLETLIPDPDESTRIKDVAASYFFLANTIEALSGRVEVDQDLLDAVRRDLGIKQELTLKAKSSTPPPASLVPPTAPARPSPPAPPASPVPPTAPAPPSPPAPPAPSGGA